MGLLFIHFPNFAYQLQKNLKRLVGNKVFLVGILIAVLLSPTFIKPIHIHCYHVHAEEETNAAAESHHHCEDCYICNTNLILFNASSLVYVFSDSFTFYIKPILEQQIPFVEYSFGWNLRAPPYL